MRSLTIFIVVFMCLGCALAQGPSQPVQTPGFDINALDRSVDPCVNFYKFACGSWMTNNPLPADKSRYGRFDELQERNRALLHQILDGLVAKNNPTPFEKKIADHYSSCMDVKGIDALGAKPLAPEMQRIAAIKTRADLVSELAHMYTIGASGVFGFYGMADLHDANMMIANVDQGGISLPDRDYYLKQDGDFPKTREKYVEHVQKMFELLGDKPEQAADQAKTVLAVETQLAEASMGRVERRDPKNRDHKMTVAELNSLAPAFEFTRFFEGIGAPKLATLNVGNPEFFKQINTQINSVALNDWKTYLRWRLLRSYADVLSTPFVDEDFNFAGKFMAGQREIEARWKRCVNYTDGDLGEMLGQLFVEKTFGADGKQRTLQMVNAIETAMGQDVQALPWMTDATKEAAAVKLAKVSNNIGYPDKWRDYSKYKVVKGDAFGNALRSNQFEVARNLAKIGKPVDRKEWGMTPPTVNAYYRSAMNDINFPAGILQPPFFDKSLDDAVNFGAIGVVIGHELTHGFDDQGAKFDAVGNLRNWWSKDDEVEFNKRTSCLADEYTKFSPVEGTNLNGRLTLGENTADNGGASISYRALQNTMKEKGEDPNKQIDGFTPEQRFFLGYAQVWCQNVTPEQARLRARTDPHSPGEFRVNGVVVNSAEFQKAYGCKAGQPMVSDNACRVW
jgi:predicted metalloendopeptidase